MGVIIRTAGQVMGLKEIKRDYNSLIKLWNKPYQKPYKSNAPYLIHEEDNIIKRSLRDYFDSSLTKLLTIRNPKKSKEFVKQFVKFHKSYQIIQKKKSLL